MVPCGKQDHLFIPRPMYDPARESLLGFFNLCLPLSRGSINTRDTLGMSSKPPS